MSGYARVTVEDVAPVAPADHYPTVPDEEGGADAGRRLRPLGDPLGATKMRPNVWEYEAGESGLPHVQHEQEEFYYVLEGAVALDVEGEAVDLEAGDAAVVEPGVWHHLEAHSDSRLLVVGAPDVPDDDAVDLEE